MTKEIEEVENEYVSGMGAMLAQADRVVMIHRLQAPIMRAEVDALFKAFCMNHIVPKSDIAMTSHILMEEFGSDNGSMRDMNAVNLYLPNVLCEIHNIGIGKGETLEDCVSSKNHSIFHNLNKACMDMIGRNKSDDETTWSHIIKNSAPNHNTVFIMLGMKFTPAIVEQINSLLAKHQNSQAIIILPAASSNDIIDNIKTSEYRRRMFVKKDVRAYPIVLNEVFAESCIYDDVKQGKIERFSRAKGTIFNNDFTSISDKIGEVFHNKATATYDYEVLTYDVCDLIMKGRDAKDINMKAVMSRRELYDNNYSKMTTLNIVKTRQRKYDQFILPYISAYNKIVFTFMQGIDVSLVSLTGNELIDLFARCIMRSKELNLNEVLFIPTIYIEEDETHWINIIASMGYKVLVKIDQFNPHKMVFISLNDDVDMDLFVSNTTLFHPSELAGVKCPSDVIKRLVAEFKIKTRSLIGMPAKYWLFRDGGSIIILNQNDEKCKNYGLGVNSKMASLSEFTRKSNTCREVTLCVNYNILINNGLLKGGI